MATSGELAQILSGLLGYQIGYVNFYGQMLRDGGLLQVGGRGRSASAMSETDAINWFVALNCAWTARTAPDVTTHALKTPFATLSFGPKGSPRSIVPNFLRKPPQDVASLVTTLIHDARDGRLQDMLIDLDFHLGGDRVEVVASHLDDSAHGFDWRANMTYMTTFKLGQTIRTRRKTEDEPPITSRRKTINRVTSRDGDVFKQIAEAVSNQDERNRD